MHYIVSFIVFLFQVICSCNHHMLLTMKGELFSWGRNDSGQLGHANRVDQVSVRGLRVGVGVIHYYTLTRRDLLRNWAGVLMTSDFEMYMYYHACSSQFFLCRCAVFRLLIR